MGYRTAELPPVDLDEFATIPFFERMKILMLHWVDHGFGTPKQTANFYAWKIFFYGLFGLIVAGAFTAGLEFNDIGGWWDEPILYQKLMIWTILLEILGLAATCGPLAFHFDPPIGGVLYWWQTDTLRVPPYPNHVPFTKGNRRTPWDTGLYKLIVFWLIMMLFLSGDPVDGLPEGRAGILPQWAVVTYCCLILLMGLRDKIVFLSARSEQYVPTLLCFGLFNNFVDMIVAAKIFICVIWMGAGFSKLQHGFSSTVSIMVQNTPWMVFPRFRRATVKDFPNDLRPSKVTHALAHIGGTTCEMVMPLVLLFSPWPWLTWIAIVSIWMLHTFIISTIPLAVPLEWNVFFMFVVAFLFANFSPGNGYAVSDMDPVLLVIVVCVALAPIILGALRPQYVSFLVGMKQYAGNWASGTFSFRDQGDGGPHQRADRQVRRQPDRPDRAAVRQGDLGDLHPEGGGLPDDASDGAHAHLGFDAPRRLARYSRPARGRVRDQRPHRLELRRRPLPRRAPDLSAAGAMPLRTGRSRGRMDRVAARLQQEGAVPGDRRRTGHGREGLVSQRRCLQRAALAPERPDPAHDHVDTRGVRAAGRRLPRQRRAGVSSRTSNQ